MVVEEAPGNRRYTTLFVATSLLTYIFFLVFLSTPVEVQAVTSHTYTLKEGQVVWFSYARNGRAV